MKRVQKEHVVITWIFLAAGLQVTLIHGLTSLDCIDTIDPAFDRTGASTDETVAFFSQIMIESRQPLSGRTTLDYCAGFVRGWTAEGPENNFQLQTDASSFVCSPKARGLTNPNSYYGLRADASFFTIMPAGSRGQTMYFKYYPAGAIDQNGGLQVPNRWAVYSSATVGEDLLVRSDLGSADIVAQGDFDDGICGLGPNELGNPSPYPICLQALLVPDYPDGIYHFVWVWTFDVGFEFTTCFDIDIRGDFAGDATATPSPSPSPCPCSFRAPEACQVVTLDEQFPAPTPSVCSLESKTCSSCVCDPSGMFTCAVQENVPTYQLINPEIPGDSSCLLQFQDIAVCPTDTAV